MNKPIWVCTACLMEFDTEQFFHPMHGPNCGEGCEKPCPVQCGPIEKAELMKLDDKGVPQ